MSWIAINGQSAPNRHAHILDFPPANKLLDRGSIICEFAPDKSGPLRLLRYHSNDQWTRSFSIYRNADGSFSLDCRQGPDHIYTRISGFSAKNSDRIRISYTWESTTRQGQFTGEDLDTGDIQSISVFGPPTLPAANGLCIVGLAGECQIDASVKFLALADHRTEIGPRPTLCADALISTPEGERKINTLKSGDLVITRSNGAQPIRQIVQQTVPAQGHACPVILCAPFFGLKQDLVVAAGQRMLVSGATTEYDFGNDGMLIEAGELVGLPGATFHAGLDTMAYFQVLLEKPGCIRVCGTWTESIFIGKLARQPQIVRGSVFSEFPIETLPVHHTRTLPILRNYERRALFGSMIA